MPQIHQLADRPAPAAEPAHATPLPPSAPSSPPPAPVSTVRPALPPDLPERFLRAAQGEGAIRYRPGAIAGFKLHFVDASSKLDTWVNRTLIAPLSDDGRSVLWEEAEEHGELRTELESAPAPGAGFAELPPGAANARNAAEWRKAAAVQVYQSSTLEILRCAELKMASAADESEGDFRARLAQALRERRDLEVSKLKAKYAPKLQTLGDQLRRAEERVAREKSQAGQQKLNTALSLGATVLGALLGRGMGVGTVGRAAAAAKSAGRIGKERADVQRAAESVEILQQRLAAMEAQFAQEAASLQTDIDPSHVELIRTAVRPRKSDITPTLIGVCWIPWRPAADGSEGRAWTRGQAW